MRSLCQMLMVLLMFSITTAIVVIRFGECPQPPIQKDFNVIRYMGRWWEYQRFPNPFEYDVGCGFANYTLLSETEVRVVNSGIKPERSFWGIVYQHRERTTSIGTAEIVNSAEPSKLYVSFKGMPEGDGKPNYFVVDTDYDNYAVVYSCQNYFFINVQFAWILTRAQGMAPNNLQQIYSTLGQSGVDLRPFITVDHSDCSL